jgi:hypothetical protein
MLPLPPEENWITFGSGIPAPINIAEDATQLKLRGTGAWPDLRLSPTFRSPHCLLPPTESISYLLFPSMSHATSHYIQHHIIDICRSLDNQGKLSVCFSGRQESSKPIRTHSSPQLVCLGSSGQRAVWLEQNYGSDDLEVRFMRLAPSQSRSADYDISPLCTNGLPFSAQHVSRIAFDEIRTRLLVSLITGDMWLLDFGCTNR